MAGKWKMAKAFGRAVFGKNDKEVPAAKMARDSYNRDLRNFVKDDDAAARAEEFHRGGQEAWMDERTLTRDKDGRPDVKLESQEVADARGDARLDDDLQKEFDDAFDEAAERHGYEKWTNEARNALNKGGASDSWVVRYGTDNGSSNVEHFNTEKEARKFYDDHFGADGIDFLEEPVLKKGSVEAFDNVVVPDAADVTQRVREEMIEELKKGMPLEDFFDKYGRP